VLTVELYSYNGTGLNHPRMPRPLSGLLVVRYGLSTDYITVL